MEQDLNELIVGQRIVKIRAMTAKEKEHEGWGGSGCTAVLELENGVRLFPSSDDEGNDGGTLFGTDKNGKAFYAYPFKA